MSTNRECNGKLFVVRGTCPINTTNLTLVTSTQESTNPLKITHQPQLFEAYQSVSRLDLKKHILPSVFCPQIKSDLLLVLSSSKYLHYELDKPLVSQSIRPSSLSHEDHGTGWFPLDVQSYRPLTPTPRRPLLQRLSVLGGHGTNPQR